MTNCSLSGVYIFMYRDFSIAAIIMAAGTGSRMNSSLSKPYIYIKGKPLLAHTLWQFQRCDIVDHILVVARQKDITRCRQDVVEKFCITKVKDIVAGGATRQQSVAAGLKEAQGDILIIHDGARPFVNGKLIEQGVKGLIERKLEGIACAVPLKDTIKLIGDGERVKRTLDRERLRAVQTPQCFLSAAVKRAHERAAGDGTMATDDLALLERYGYKVGLYPGIYDNIKITTQEDLLLAEVIMERHDRS